MHLSTPLPAYPEESLPARAATLAGPAGHGQQGALAKAGSLLPGLALAGGLAFAAILLGKIEVLQANGIGALTLAVVLGMLAGHTAKARMAAACTLGVAFSKQGLLRLGIILYGLRLTFQDIGHVGLTGVLIDATVLCSTFALSWWVGTRVLGLDRKTAMLIGAGSSICGAAAVMAAEPVVQGRAEQVTVAVSTVVVFGTLAIFLYPLLYHLNEHGHLISMSPRAYGIFAGSTIHEVAQVVAAGNAISVDAGNTAVIAKMVRVMMLAPFLIVLSACLSRSKDAARAGHGTAAERATQKPGRIVIPWFALGFVAVAGLNSLAILPAPVVEAVTQVDTVLLAMAMAALGVTTRISAIRNAGIKPLALAALLFAWLLGGGLAINAGVTALFAWCATAARAPVSVWARPGMAAASEGFGLAGAVQCRVGSLPGALSENQMKSDTYDEVPAVAKDRIPKVAFASLGCPKALTDSELILTRLRAEGYETSKSFAGADLVIVNTCGFIDDAVRESLDTIGEALAENGKVIVTGCLGAKAGEAGGNLVRQMHPSVLAVTGPHATEEVMDAVHLHSPKRHDPFVDLVPAAAGDRAGGFDASIGIKLTPRHYAYLKISEGCNHRCTFCIIPSLRGDLVSRPIGDVLGEAGRLFASGVKELLVISQDTSAYGVDVKFRTGFWEGRPVRTHMTELCERLAQIAAVHGAWVRLHYVYPYPHVDQILPLMASGGILPYLDVPFQHSHPDVLRRMKRPASGEKNLERLQRWREACPQLVVRSTFIAGFPGETEAEFEHLLDFIREAQIDRAGCFAYSPVDGAAANALPGMLPAEVREERRARFMAVAEAVSAARLARRVGATMQVLVDSAPALGRRGGVGRSYADAPEIDGTVRLLPPEKASKTLKAGEFTRARIVAAEGHDLVALPL